jgi:acyl-homoserine lactone synthase
MIIVEQQVSGPRQTRALQAMFEARKQVFVDLLKWDVPVIEDRFELDQFDDEHAHYLIVADSDGTHLGSARLLPTLRPHILGDLYPQLCAGRVPRGPDIFEITRFCLARNQGAIRRRQTRDRLITALVQFARQTGIGMYTGVADIAWLQQILAFGWDCRPLGPPQALACGLTGALAIAVGPETQAGLERNGIWTGDCAMVAHLAAAA